MVLPRYKSNRLQRYDYSTEGAYFITFCVRERKPILWEVEANSVRPEMYTPLSNIGRIVDQGIQNIPSIYHNVSIEKYRVMPDHVHALIFLYPDGKGRTMFVPTISRIVKQLKGWITKQIGLSIWQNSFYDHIIRNEKDYQNAWLYIDANPSKINKIPFPF